jgi:hypothetical protein
MSKRWTIKELQGMSDRAFVMAVLRERKQSCTNPNAPLTRRLDATLTRLERADILEDGRERFASRDADGKVRRQTEEGEF